jgi:hypothetical protein
LLLAPGTYLAEVRDCSERQFPLVDTVLLAPYLVCALPFHPLNLWKVEEFPAPALCHTDKE